MDPVRGLLAGAAHGPGPTTQVGPFVGLKPLGPVSLPRLSVGPGQHPGWAHGKPEASRWDVLVPNPQRLR